MLRKVWKYPLSLTGAAQPIEVTDRAFVVHTAIQHGYPTIWIDLDTEAPPVTREFTVFGTGHTIPGHAIHVGTCFDGPLVWHVYDITEE